MQNEKNKIKRDTTQEVISRNQFSKRCSSNFEVYNSIIYEQNVRLVLPIS